MRPFRITLSLAALLFSCLCPADILAQTGTSDLESAFLALDMGEAPGAGEGPGAGEEPDAGKEPGAGEGSDAGKEATDA